MSVNWIQEPSGVSGTRAVRWLGEPGGRLGLFSEKTSGECMSNLYNQDACNALCYAVGITGYGAFLITPCQNQCMIEMCGQGILPPCKLPPTGLPCNPLATQKEMQKAGVVMSPCVTSCMDAFQQGEFGTDEDALKKAARQCLQKCGIVQAVSSSSSTKPSGGGTKPSGGGKTTTAPSAPAVGRATAAGSGLLILGLIGAAIAGAAYLSKKEESL